MPPKPKLKSDTWHNVAADALAEGEIENALKIVASHDPKAFLRFVPTGSMVANEMLVKQIEAETLAVEALAGTGAVRPDCLLDQVIDLTGKYQFPANQWLKGLSAIAAMAYLENWERSSYQSRILFRANAVIVEKGGIHASEPGVPYDPVTPVKWKPEET